MNLLMIILIALGIWVGAAICYFAWRVMPEVPGTDPGDAKSGTEKVAVLSDDETDPGEGQDATGA